MISQGAAEKGRQRLIAGLFNGVSGFRKGCSLVNDEYGSL
jgi:hypothetical protein